MQFFKSRSITRCFVDGWKNIALNHKQHLRFFWLPALLCATALGLCFAATLLFYHRTHQIFVLLDYVGGATFNEMCELLQPFFSPLIAMLVGWIVALAGYCLIKGSMVTQIRLYRATDSLPAMSAWSLRKEIFKDTSRIFLFIVLRSAILCLLLAPTVWLAMNITEWCWLPAFVLFVAIMLPSSLLRMYYQQHTLTLRQTLTKSLRKAMSGFGKWIVLKLMTGIFAILCYGILLLPVFYVILQTHAVAESSLLDPDVVLPPYFSSVMFITAFCAALLCTVIDLVVTWQNALFIGSQHADENVQEAAMPSPETDGNAPAVEE